MKYRLLGNSGLRVSEVALGTMTFGEDWGCGAPKEEAQKVYNAFCVAGGNFIDTANVYTNGASETFLRHRSGPVIPIIGARKPPQLQDNLASVELSLAADQLKTLDEASRIDLGFPQEIFTRELTRGLRSGGMADRIIA